MKIIIEGAACPFAAFDEPAWVVSGRKKIFKKVKSKDVASDGLTLKDREATCSEVLAKAGISEASLTLVRAVKLHATLEDKDLKRALRVAIVSKTLVCADNGVSLLLPLFNSELKVALSELADSVDSRAVANTRAAFVKAAKHKVHGQ